MQVMCDVITTNYGTSYVQSNQNKMDMSSNDECDESKKAVLSQLVINDCHSEVRVNCLGFVQSLLMTSAQSRVI